MKRKLALAVLTASFYVAFPVLAQNASSHGDHHGGGGGHGRGHGHHGNNSNHSGHDDDGNSGGHHHGDDQDGDHNLVLANPGVTSSVASALTSVSAALKSASLTTKAGTPIPAAAQSNTLALLDGARDQTASTTAIKAALSSAGPQAAGMVPSLVQSVAALERDPSRLPATVAQYNSFTKAASSEFIANPPSEYIALHAVLARLIAAAAAK